MSWLAPLFLIGLAALAAPVLVHLVNRERRQAVAFPSLMFLRRIPFRSVRRQRIRHWTLFLLRCLALILIAAAFARPFLDRRDALAAGAAAGAREVVILLDRSYSMGYGERWARATGAARRAIESLTPADRGTLILFDQSAVAAAAPTSDQTVLRTALDGARPASGVTRYAPPLALAQQLLERAERPRREVILISDFQRTGWDRQELPRLPSGATITTVAVQDSATANVAVTGVEMRRQRADGERDRLVVAARLASSGGRPLSNVPVSLDINGRQLESRTVAMPAVGATTVTFDPAAVPGVAARGTVRVGAHPANGLPADDSFHFVAAPGQAIGVLLIEHASASPGRAIFLQRALGIGDRPSFRLVTRRSDRVAAADVDGASLVILHDAPIPAGAAGERIAGLVRAGGGLLIALGEQAGPRAWSSAGMLLPGTVGSVIDRSAERGGTLGFLDRGHAALETFRAPRSGDFSSARFLRYRALTPTDPAAVLARFDDGTVALSERRVGRGRVLVWASTLDTYWNDLAVQPVYLPLVQSLARYAAGFRDEPAWHIVGQALSLDGPEGEAASALVATSPSGQKVRWSESQQHRALALEEQGFYDVRAAGASTPARIVAANLDLMESDLTAFPPEELARAASPATGPSQAQRAGATLSLEERERRQSLWWYILLGALLALAAETVLSNRLSRSASAGQVAVGGG